QGMGGFMCITGAPDGEPQKGGVPVADLIAGMYAAIGISAALRHREVTGEGQYVDIGMLDTQVATLSIQGLNYLASREVPKRLGNVHPNIVPYQVFSTSDGDIVLAVGNDSQFQRFCEFAGIPEVASEEKYSANDARVRNRDALTAILNPVLAAHPSRYWIEGLEPLSVSCGPINTIDQVFADPQVEARGMKIEMPHPATKNRPVDLIGSPLKMSATPPSYRHAPPILGQSTDEVLRELLGIDEQELADLRKKGVI
ncbi:MAG: CaiB/BaiF CoA-transferase family protein, partial [Verrucomicrobia bacterium]|nr:CaiB/BaiF CoA-transferase family protein [Verrucomicrobiota bacterium]